jgi:hypothetical protein
MINMTRIEKLIEIARENGVTAIVRELSGNTFASINGQSFKVAGYASFNAKCKELKSYIAPHPIELTSRLSEIENAALGGMK